MEMIELWNISSAGAKNGFCLLLVDLHKSKHIITECSVTELRHQMRSAKRRRAYKHMG